MIAAMALPASTRELDDLSVARARLGEADACRRLVELYERRVFALLSRMLAARGERALVEDLAQETFLRAFRALPTYTTDGPAKLSTWILTIATRLALDELARRQPVLISVDAAAHLPAETPPDRLDRAHLQRALDRALEGLPPEQRAVFVLREHYELAYEKIGRALDVDLNTVKTRLFRARTALRIALSEVHRAL